MIDRSAGKNEFALALAAAGVDAHASLRESSAEIQARLAELPAGRSGPGRSARSWACRS
ncbi:hypothetical protein ACIRPK_02300 [Kitasatospora sp. NPDC101801]|uniref:hypothetical protein n=1 Tax=Kitasatospora sp. NPDC101801 TaxID=3364103 RepID=UPI0038008770